MSTTLTPRPEINASNVDTQRNGPNKIDHSYPPTKGPYKIMSPEDRVRYIQILAGDGPMPAFEKRDRSKLASYKYKSSRSTEQLTNETAALNAKPWSRDRPSLPSASINGMLPLVDFKEKPNDDAKKVESATVVPQNHRRSDITGQTDAHHESVETPAAPLGSLIGSRDNHAESSNQARARDIPQAKFVGYRAAPGRAPYPEPTIFSTNLPRTSDLTREMQARRDTFRSSRENAHRPFYKSLSQPKGNRSDRPIPSDLARDRQAHLDALRSSREKTNRLLYENLSQQKDNLGVANKPSSHNPPYLATKGLTRHHLPQTPVLRPTQEQSKVVSATLPDQQHQTQEADNETKLDRLLGRLPPLESNASNVQRPSKAALLEYQIQLHNLERQAYLHGFGTWQDGSYGPNYTLSDEEMEMIYTFTRKLSKGGKSAEPQNLQDELTTPHKLNMAQKGPQKTVVTEDKRQIQDAMLGDQHNQYGQARSTHISSPLVSLPGGLQDIHATWSEPEVVKTIPVDAHCSQKKAPVDGSYLAQEERKVLDHVRGSMSTNFSVTKVPDPSSTNTGENLEPANTSVEDLQKLNDFPIVRECMVCHVGCVRRTGFPLNGSFSRSRGPAREASTPSMAQVHKATQTYPGQKTDSYKEQDAVVQGQSVNARSWNTTNMEASRIVEGRANVLHARYSGEPKQTWASPSNGAMSVASTAIDTTASRIPVRESSTVVPPLYEYLPYSPESDTADLYVARSNPSAPATCGRSVFSKMQSSGAQTAPSVSPAQHSKVTYHDPRTTNNQVKPAKYIPNELNLAQNRTNQGDQVTGKSPGFLGIFQDISHGTDSQATNDTSIAEDHAESAAKPVVSNKLQLSDEKGEQITKERPRSLRDLQRAMGSTESTANLLATSRPSLTGDICSDSAEKKLTAIKFLSSMAEDDEKYEKARSRELTRALQVDLSPKGTEAEVWSGPFELARSLHLDLSLKRTEAENRSGPLELAENPDGSNSNLRSFDQMRQSQGYYQLPYNINMLGESEPQAINEPRAVKAEFNEPGEDTVFSKARDIVEREGPRTGYRKQDLELFTRARSLRCPEYPIAKINPPTTDSTSSTSQSWVEARAVRVEKPMSDFGTQPRIMTAHKGPISLDCDSKSRSGSSPMTAHPASHNLLNWISNPKSEMRSDMGGPDIDHWRRLVDFDSKALSAAALAAAKEKLTFNKEPILGSAPVEQEDTKPTSLPVPTRGVAYNPLAAEKVTIPFANPRTTSIPSKGVRISVTGDAEARSAAVSTDIFIARDEDEDDEKGEQDDWTLLDSVNSSRRHSFVDFNEVLEATPSEASDPSSMDVEVGDERSEVNENDWIIC